VLKLLLLVPAELSRMPCLPDTMVLFTMVKLLAVSSWMPSAAPVVVIMLLAMVSFSKIRLATL
jgi:hypothetical protein